MWPLEKTHPPPGGHVFQATGTIFEFVQDIIGTNLLTKFHDDRKINVASRVLTRFYYSHIRNNALSYGGHVFQQTGIIFEFHEDRITDVVSRVLTRNKMRFWGKPTNQQTNQPTDQQTGQTQYVPHYYSGGHKNAQPLGSHAFQANVTIFKLILDIIETNLLTKFHEDWK
ncbi:hypothetical protein DPMN_039939 [Dreissena polymorpha]|uniref:Uncharacterized protein n=1 Tax=Dreissena polymorpha TaxID=45954 RepID=A0A9D4HSK8_DREPO|nr:hypothetical protein DPMN_039939 [Dreissena polymorpha]